MKILTALILIISTGISSHAQSSDFFSQADLFFSEYVTNGKVDYMAIKDDPNLLNSLLGKIESMNLNKQESATNKAFLINAYNLLTIGSILDNDIPQSPLDVEGFFDRKTHNIGGMQRTLDQIEKEMLLPVYNDSRIHFVLVCAAEGCPPLKSFAYVPDKLDKQMEEATVAVLNSDYFIRIDTTNMQVLVSEIFKWYEQDFLAEEETLLKYINKYRKEKVPTTFKLSYYNYDWSLNSK